MPQLDGLRAVAILAVIWSHTLPAQVPTQIGIVAGRAGVLLFFVLSGYLITDNLLRNRDQGSPALILRSFYARRSLRIFPLYYLTLFVVALLGYAPVRDHLAWHLVYASNLAAASGIDLKYCGHFWSLSVEEQFYVVWPAMVLLTPRRWLQPAILMSIAVGPLYRLVGSLLGWHWFALVWTLPGTIESLSLGALLALYSQSEQPLPVARLRLMWAGLTSLSALAAMELAMASVPKGEYGVPLWRPYPILHVFLTSLAVVPLVAMASSGGLRCLEARPLRYIGRISYGIYLFQSLLLLVVPHSFWVLTACSIALASVTWHSIEAPTNALKRFFPYGRAG